MLRDKYKMKTKNFQTYPSLFVCCSGHKQVAISNNFKFMINICYNGFPYKFAILGLG